LKKEIPPRIRRAEEEDPVNLLRHIFSRRVNPNRPIKIDSKWNPGTKLTLMSYAEALNALKSGDPKRMSEAIGRNILNAPKLYDHVCTSLNFPQEETLRGMLLPLLKHQEYSVRCSIPSVLAEIGDATIIPHLEDVMQHDQHSQVRKNARIAIDIIKSKTANIGSVKLVRRYTKPIPGEAITGTYEEYAAPNKAVARAFLATKSITKDYFYIEVVTPEGNLGKDKLGLFGEAKLTITTVQSRRKPARA
jgi:hypothetical protein